MTTALRVARLSARTQLQSQLLGLLSDPVYSSILGFVIVGELQRRGLLATPQAVALYAAIAAANTARQPALMELAGRALGLDGAVLPVAGGAAVGGAVGARAALPAAARAALPAAARAALPAAATAGGAMVVDKVLQRSLPVGARAYWKRLPLWQRLSPIGWGKLVSYGFRKGGK